MPDAYHGARLRPTKATATNPLNRRSAFYDPINISSSLPSDPKTWSPTDVSLYLCHILHLVPAPVMETLREFVAKEHLTGRAFLRIKESDLAQKGMNTRWRMLLSEASRRLRRDALRRRIWSGNEWGGGGDDDCEHQQENTQTLTPSQKRMMTATLKRIRDRKQVKGLIAALESPSGGKELDIEAESPRVAYRGTGLVQRRATSFDDLIGGGCGDEPRRRQRSDESLRHERESSGSMSSSSSCSLLDDEVIQTPTDEIATLDLTSLSPEEDASEDNEAWKPLEQDLVDAILCAGTSEEEEHGDDTDDESGDEPVVEELEARPNTDIPTIKGENKVERERVEEQQAEFKAPHVSSIFEQPAVTQPEAQPEAQPEQVQGTMSRGKNTLSRREFKSTRGRKGGQELLSLLQHQVTEPSPEDVPANTLAPPPSLPSSSTSYFSISRAEAERILSQMQGVDGSASVDVETEDSLADASLEIDLAADEGRESSLSAHAADSEESDIPAGTTAQKSWLLSLYSSLDSRHMSYALGLGAGVGFVVISEVLRGGGGRR